VRAAAIQISSSEHTSPDHATAERLVRDAAAGGARLIVLPEKWNVPLGDPERMLAAAQPLDGPTVRWASALARELGIDLVAGSIVERVEGQAKGANTSVHLGPDGELRAVYRKLHLFDVEVAGEVYRESDTDEPGDEIVSSQLADGTVLGMSVCYDIRFPELYRALAARGARILSVPAAFTLRTTRDQWEVMLRARAIENQVFVVAANQFGEHAPRKSSGGRSSIVDAWGAVLAQAPEEGEAAIVADLDFDAQDGIRARMPLAASRRPEVYARGEEAKV